MSARNASGRQTAAGLPCSAPPPPDLPCSVPDLTQMLENRKTGREGGRLGGREGDWEGQLWQYLYWSGSGARRHASSITIQPAYTKYTAHLAAEWRVKQSVIYLYRGVQLRVGQSVKWRKVESF